MRVEALAAHRAFRIVPAVVALPTLLALIALIALLAFPARLVASAAAGPPSPAGVVLWDEPVSRAVLFRLQRVSDAPVAAAARSATRWAASRPGVAVVRGRDGLHVEDSAGARLPLDASLVVALERLAAYLELADRRASEPVESALLERALLSDAGVRAVRDAFDTALARPIVLDDVVLVPEIGGELLLRPGTDGWRPELVVIDDTAHSAARAVAERRRHPTAVGQLFDEREEAMRLLDEAGQLERELALWEARTERGMPEEKRRRAWSLAVETVLTNAADAHVMTPQAQLDAIVSRDWPADARLVGAWHLHPPAVSSTDAGMRLTPGGAPSPDDRAVARSLGRYLTIRWLSDGFDAWDLGRDARPRAPVRHRSQAWAIHDFTVPGAREELGDGDDGRQR